MSSSGLIRWGGLAAMLAGVAFVVDGLLVLASAEALWTDSVFTFAFLFVLVGMVGFHALQVIPTGASDVRGSTHPS